MMNKKAFDVDPLKLIIAAVVLLVVAVIIIAIFRGIFGKEAKQVETQISGLTDSDGDGQADFLDPCPCDPYDNCNKKNPDKSCIKS